MTKIVIRLDGVPGVKGRPQVARTKTGVRVFSRTKTISYESRLRDAGKDAWPWAPLLCPIKMTLVAVFPIAQSWPKWKRVLAALKGIWHTQRPDLDNIIKIAGDGLNETVWADDGQVCHIDARKQFGEHPALWLTIETIDDIGGDLNDGGHDDTLAE